MMSAGNDGFRLFFFQGEGQSPRSPLCPLKSHLIVAWLPYDTCVIPAQLPRLPRGAFQSPRPPPTPGHPTPSTHAALSTQAPGTRAPGTRHPGTRHPSTRHAAPGHSAPGTQAPGTRHPGTRPCRPSARQFPLSSRLSARPSARPSAHPQGALLTALGMRHNNSFPLSEMSQMLKVALPAGGH